jgi:hypothetical protein
MLDFAVDLVVHRTRVKHAEAHSECLFDPLESETAVTPRVVEIDMGTGANSDSG